MDTVRVDICYRPLRIGWAIRDGDLNAFRQAVRLSHTLWGGRYNPILVVDREAEARRLADLFRVDIIYPIGDTDEVKTFSKNFPHLNNPMLSDGLFVEGGRDKRRAQVLDVQNQFEHLREKREWHAINDLAVRLYTWHFDDPLSDLLLIQFGAYPSPDEIGIDYRAMLREVAEATEHSIDSRVAIPSESLLHPSIPYFSRYGLKRHFSVQSRWNSGGFFVGDSQSANDLISYWNLRATDIPLWFIDPKHMARYSEIVPAWEQSMRRRSENSHDRGRNVAVWSTREDIEEVCKSIGEKPILCCRVDDPLWNGRNIRIPMMYLGNASVLGVLGTEGGKPKVSFALSEKPFCSNMWFHTQHLVASISFVGGLYDDEHHTLSPPYVPELNEFYTRSMGFRYATLRIEPERIGMIIDAADHDSNLYALPVADMMERIFDMAGYTSKLSAGGLITRQLISHLGGIRGARPFKIPGVRRLLKKHGPTASVTKRAALQLIGSSDPDNPGASFNDHEGLYIEPRLPGSKLQPSDVFAYLVTKGLFRIGVQLICPNCRMNSWTALDNLKQRVMCELCGHDHDATRQLVNGEWYYRRSGVLGLEKNAQGAVPVALTLQQLQSNLHGELKGHVYSVSLDLGPKDGNNLPKCEIDFVWIIPRAYPRKTVVILGECKDQGPIALKDFEKDIENLRCVADALPRKRFKTFVLLAKLNPFTPDEIRLAVKLQDDYRHRAILLTARELEPYHMYERTKLEFPINRAYGGSPEDLADVTTQLYFNGSG